LKAVIASLCTVEATASPSDSMPVKIPGGKPVIEVPGNTARLPSTNVRPVFVIVVAPITAYRLAVPRLISWP
jgi:hypothetical protein